MPETILPEKIPILAGYLIKMPTCAQQISATVEREPWQRWNQRRHVRGVEGQLGQFGFVVKSYEKGKRLSMTETKE